MPYILPIVLRFYFYVRFWAINTYKLANIAKTYLDINHYSVYLEFRTAICIASFRKSLAHIIRYSSQNNSCTQCATQGKKLRKGLIAI
jgi:hypothetical protein